MPLVHTDTIMVTCDNPYCPGNNLNPDKREGWIFITSELYGNQVQSFVFCSDGCVEAAAGNPATNFASGPAEEAT